MVTYLGIRHLSPNGAYHVRKELEARKPDMILIEGPCDFTPLIPEFSNLNIKPPFAILAYTLEKPIQTILYPMAVYSPEYQAVLWANEAEVSCAFIDLPSHIMLSEKLKRSEEAEENKIPHSNDIFSRADIWKQFDEKLNGYETFWEQHIEHHPTEYFSAVSTFGSELRQTEVYHNHNIDYSLLRERHMKMQIAEAEKSGKENIVVLVGAYHIDGLQNDELKPINAKELKSLSTHTTNHTLMPYSYYKLSSQSGYGAGNKAPFYYHMIWDALQNNNLQEVSLRYLTNIAREMRKQGHNASSAQVIEAMQLATSLANLNNRIHPTLADLQDATMTCYGEGQLSSIASARTLTEIGLMMGSLPDGASNTSIQQDFKNQLKELKLERYVDLQSSTLDLDLRENLRVKSEKSAFLDLNRSFFFHKLHLLQIPFSSPIHSAQASATFRESWTLQWNTEVEIALIENSLKGETLDLALISSMREKMQTPTIEVITQNILDSFLCGLSNTFQEFIIILQSATIENTDFIGFINCMNHLTKVIAYGDLRKISTDFLHDILKTLYLKTVLLAEENSNCQDDKVKDMMKGYDLLQQMSIDFPFIDATLWYETLEHISNNLFIHQFLSGYATAILLEQGKLSPEDIEQKISFYFSKGLDGFQTANWLEGFCMKNRYQLLLNLNIWKQFDVYIKTLSLEEFKRVVLFLRRAFANFNSNEKNSIVDNLKEIWGIQLDNSLLHTTISKQELYQFIDLDEFDFDNI